MLSEHVFYLPEEQLFTRDFKNVIKSLKCIYNVTYIFSKLRDRAWLLPEDS